jgi:hypothetical protein
MPGTTSWCSSKFGWLLVLLISGCRISPTPDQKIEVNVSQNWQLQAGSTIEPDNADADAAYRVTSGLGDIAIQLSDGMENPWQIGYRSVYAPFAGEVRIDSRHCLFYMAAEIPAYAFRLCGLTPAKLGKIAAGAPIGHGRSLQFATLRKQPNGKWAIVEPDQSFIKKLLKAP